MNFLESALTGDERIIFTLRSLYAQYGYQPYKMSKFEEYDLYGRNKEFLISDGVITFTDSSGKLLALKPDVTLSIVKNTRDIPGSVQKLYYNENVYRMAGGAHNFRELMQVGLECLGDVDAALVSETLYLAAKSLGAVSEDFVLDISHLGLTAAVVDSLPLPDDARQKILSCIGGKNLHEAAAICAEYGVPDELADALRTLMTTSGTPDEVLPKLRPLAVLCHAEDTLAELEAVLGVFIGSEYEGKIRIDASVVNDMNYYNGIVFNGFLRGLPECVLSGGQYDRLMKKMQRSARAIGFALYLDQLGLLDQKQPEYDVDLMLLYDKETDPAELRAVTSRLIAEGRTVFACPGVNPKLKCREILRLENGEVKPIV